MTDTLSKRSVANVPDAPSPGQTNPVCQVTGLYHQYDNHVALKDVHLNVYPGEIVAVLGPNGSGKTTLFRLLCTLMPVQRGMIKIDDVDASKSPLEARQRIGIIFQAPSLDVQLTVTENLICQGALHGLGGAALRERCDTMLRHFGLADRSDDLCKSLSGGLKRRVELAKGMLHQPSVLLLDEPSTGLDPSARMALWAELEQLATGGVAVLLTTHLMEEAERASRVMMLDAGRKVADSTPSALRDTLGSNVITIQVEDPEAAQVKLRESIELSTQIIDGRLSADLTSPEMVPRIMETVGDHLQSITVGKPELEHAFTKLTGKPFVGRAAGETS
ncbi:MAG: ATP-binding cassette domain-containing protein [Planctomycetota bacterium]